MTPTYIATYALSAFYDDIGDVIDDLIKAEPDAIAVFIHPVAEDGVKPKAEPLFGRAIRFVNA